MVLVRSLGLSSHHFISGFEFRSTKSLPHEKCCVLQEPLSIWFLLIGRGIQVRGHPPEQISKAEIL